MFNSADIPQKHYDWNASLKLIGNKESAARELALMLKEILPEFAQKLHAAFDKNDVKEIQTIAHKLHGGICYVAAPRLQYLVEHLETACKQQPEQIASIRPYIVPSIEALDKTLTQVFN